MKIAIVNQAHPGFGGPGGAERSVKTLAEGLARRGHDVTSIAMAQAANTRHLSESGMHSEHRISGVHTILLGKVSRSPTEVEMIKAIVEKNNFDVIHTNTFWHNIDLWREVSNLKIPIVHTLREYKLMCPNNMYIGGRNCDDICSSCQLAARVNRGRSRLVDAVVGISRFVLDRHLKHGLFTDTASKSVIHNSVSGRPSSGVRTPDESNRLRLGFLGRLHPTKGVHRLIDAVVARPDDRVHLTLAGEIQSEDIDARMQEIEGDPRFDYLGFVDPTELLERVDVLVVPSDWPEPFGRIVIEAYLNGVPVLASNSGGLPEIVVADETGWVFGGENPGLGDAIENLLTIRDRIPDMGERCIEEAKKYRPESVAEQYERVYLKVLKNHRSPQTENRRIGFRNILGRKSGPSANERAGRGRRVLVVTGEFPKLSETFVINHITGLIELGLDVTIFAEHRGGADQWHRDVDRYRLMDKVLWYGMPEALRSARDHLSRTSKEIQRNIRDLTERASIVGLPPPMDEVARQLMDEQARTDLKLRLFHAAEVLNNRGAPFDIAHCHFGHRGLFASELKKMGVLDAKIAVSFHGIDVTEHIRRKGIHVYDALKKQADLSLPISNFFRERLLKLGMSPQSTLVHHVGIDCDTFRFRPRVPNGRGQIRILTVGRLVPKKGVEYAIRAVDALVKDMPSREITYDIIGDGPEHSRLVKLAGELGLGDVITFHGSLPHDEISGWMAKSHIFLAPSVTGQDGDMEGIPTTIMEAMASGMPVVSTLHSGIPELVQDGETGLLCAERDYKALAEKLKLFCANPEIWPEFGSSARKVVEKDFNIAKQNARVVRYYDELTAGQAAH